MVRQTANTVLRKRGTEATLAILASLSARRPVPGFPFVARTGARVHGRQCRAPIVKMRFSFSAKLARVFDRLSEGLLNDGACRCGDTQCACSGRDRPLHEPQFFPKAQLIAQAARLRPCAT